MLCEMVLEHLAFAALGSLFGSMVISMLIKSTCKRSIGVVDPMRCKGTLDNLSSCCKQCVQDFRDFYFSPAIPGHQKHSCNRDKVQSHP